MAISKTKQMKWKYVISPSTTNKMFLYFCFEAKIFAFQRKLKEFCILFSLSALFFLYLLSLFSHRCPLREKQDTLAWETILTLIGTALDLFDPRQL